MASTFKGKIIGEDLTKWPDQLDFSAELSKARAAKPDAIFVFYPGAAGVQFLKQYAQPGLKGQIPLYTAFTIDELSLPLQKDLALGVPGAQQWVNDLPNDANKKFVADFNEKYKTSPSFYGAQTYDAAQLINSAVVAVKGDLTKKDAMRDEMRKANFPSVRGPYKYGNNHIPIQNFYLQDVVKNADGSLGLKTVATIVEGQPGPLPRQVPDEVVDLNAGRTAGVGEPAVRPFSLTDAQVRGIDESAPWGAAFGAMLLFIEQCLNGLQFGLLLFLLAAGLTLVFGIMDLVNLAHGSLYMIGAYFAATFAALTGSFRGRDRAGAGRDAGRRHGGRGDRAAPALWPRSSRPRARAPSA